MANIPLPRTPDVKSATGFSQVDPSTGTAPNRALVGLGGAIAETGKTFDMFADKRQKLINDQAEAELDLEFMRANGEIDQYAIENQHDPDSITAFSKQRLGLVWDKVTSRNKVDKETDINLNRKYSYLTERTNIGVKSKVTALEVKNANAVQYNLAQSYRRANQPQAAFDALKKMSVSSDQLYANMTAIFSEGVATEVSSRIRSANIDGDIQSLEGIRDELLEKGDDGRYTQYEYTVMDNGKEIPAGGLSSGARDLAVNEIESKIRMLEVKGIRGQRKAMKEYMKDGSMPPLDPNLPVEVRDKLEDVRATDWGKLGVTSNDFLETQKAINSEIKAYLTDGYVGMSNVDRDSLWKQIQNGGYTQSARMQLMTRMLAAEELRAGREEEAGEGFWGFFTDPDLPSYKQNINEQMVSRYRAEADLINEGLGDDGAVDALGSFMDAMNELETKMEGLTEEKAGAFMDVEFPKIWETHMGKVENDFLDSTIYN
jgi:hypothetical protein